MHLTVDATGFKVYGEGEWHVTAMNRYKTIIGPRLRVRCFKRQKTEAAIDVSVLNRFTALGMPISVAL